MKQAHINITIIIVVIILIIAGFRVYNNKQKSKEEALRKKNQAGNGAEYNKDKQADPAKLLDDTTLKADVKKLRDAFGAPIINFGGVDNNMGYANAVAHSMSNQAQWSQVLNEYANENNTDLYTDMKQSMASYIPILPPYEKEREDAIQTLKDFIKISY